MPRVEVWTKVEQIDAETVNVATVELDAELGHFNIDRATAERLLHEAGYSPRDGETGSQHRWMPDDVHEAMRILDHDLEQAHGGDHMCDGEAVRKLLTWVEAHCV